MDKLNSDEKILILMKLSSQEMLKVCQTNRDLSRVCGDPRYNPLWIQKIREDFNVTYKENEFPKNTFEEYKRLFMLFNTLIFTVITYDVSFQDFESVNFLKRKDAERYIHLQIRAEYSRVAASLQHSDSYFNGRFLYSINSVYIKKSEPELNVKFLQDNETTYETKTEYIYNLLEKKGEVNGVKIADVFHHLMNDIFDDIVSIRHDQNYHEEVENYIVNNVSIQIATFIYDYGLKQYEKEIKNYVNYII